MHPHSIELVIRVPRTSQGVSAKPLRSGALAPAGPPPPADISAARAPPARRGQPDEISESLALRIRFSYERRPETSHIGKNSSNALLQQMPFLRNGQPLIFLTAVARRPPEPSRPPRWRRIGSTKSAVRNEQRRGDELAPAHIRKLAYQADLDYSFPVRPSHKVVDRRRPTGAIGPC
jgi:hypothetical protein